MSIYHQELKEIKKLARCRYIPPLPIKTQRVTARAERCSKPRIYTEEEKFLYLLKKYNK